MLSRATKAGPPPELDAPVIGVGIAGEQRRPVGGAGLVMITPAVARSLLVALPVWWLQVREGCDELGLGPLFPPPPGRPRP